MTRSNTIPAAFSSLSKDLNELWEVHVALTQYLPEAESRIYAGRLPPLRIAPFVQPSNAVDKSARTTVGVLQRARVRSSHRTLIEAVARFEVFVGEVAKSVYFAFGPERLTGPDGITNDSQLGRLVGWVFESADRDEIIERIIDDRVRSLTYGNGADLLVKDRARLGLGTHFRNGHDTALDSYAEVLGRRNVIVHSAGRIDRAYLARHPDSSLKLGSKVAVSDGYLGAALGVLRQLATCLAYLSGSAVAGHGLEGDIKRRFDVAHRHSA